MANSVMMFDVLGYPEDHPQRAIARAVDREASGRARARGLLPALRLADLGHRARLPRAAGSRRRTRRRREVKRGLEWLVPMQVLDVRGDWIARRPDVRPGGWAFQYANRIIPTSTTPPSSPWRWIGCRTWSGAEDFDASLARAANGSSACRARTAAGARSTPTTNSTISTTSRSPTTARCSIRRPRTSPRAACRCWRNSARPRQTARRSQRAIDYLRAHPARRRQLVRPLGHELHLRHLVGAVRAQRRRRRSRRAGNAQGGELARSPSRTPTAAGARTAQATSSTTAATSARRQHRVTNRLGAARPDGGRRRRSSGGGARHRLSHRRSKAPTASGTSRATPPRVSRACSICATTAMRNSSRCGRWRATAISRAATRARWRSGCSVFRGLP